LAWGAFILACLAWGDTAIPGAALLAALLVTAWA